MSIYQPIIKEVNDTGFSSQLSKLLFDSNTGIYYALPLVETEATLESLGAGRVQYMVLPKYFPSVEGLVFTMEVTGDWVPLVAG